MALSGFSIFFLLTGIIAIQLLQVADAHMDWISFTYLLFNFAMVGALTMFYAPAPLLLKQVYLVVTGVVTAFVFTWIPEWTTWVLLVAMALYDIVAVLVPGGPLKMLVELAQEREEELPALVYQARGRSRPRDYPSNSEADVIDRPTPPPRLSDINESEQPLPPQPDTPLIPTTTPRSQESFETEVESEIFELPDAIKLGLGDFIFYSVLVGRAAMYDYLTVLACFIAIIAGLGCTLLWLAVAHKALPALPVSIALAVIFYFVSRFVMEPVILPMTLELVYF
jgi:presenilin 1